MTSNFMPAMFAEFRRLLVELLVESRLMYAKHLGCGVLRHATANGCDGGLHVWGNWAAH